MSERVLVTGAQGFIGRYTIAHWLAASEEDLVVGLGRSPAKEDCFTHEVHWGDRALDAPLPPPLGRALDTDRYRYVPVDLCRRSQLIELLRELQPTIVLHLAASLRDDPPDQLVRNNVGATVSLLEGICGAEIPLPRVVLGSTGGVYGDPGEALPISEDHPANPVDFYSASKKSAEDIGRILARQRDIPVLWARIFNPLGPGQDERHLAGWLACQVAAISAGLKPPRLECGPLVTTRDFVDVRDVGRALKILAERGELGAAYNVGSGRETPVRDVLNETLRLAELPRPVKLVTLPGRPADVPRHVADIGRLRALGFEPEHDVSRSITDVLSYYRQIVGERARSGSGALPRDTKNGEHREVVVEAVHRYPVIIEVGLAQRLPGLLRSFFPSARFMMLTDERVAELHGNRLLKSLESAGISVESVVLPAGERSKTPETYLEVIERLYRGRFDRRAVLLCFGGGTITDLGGFVASSYMRSVAYVDIPTTLVAQHDAAVGGKVAVNMPWAKNFVGAFHHPRAVFTDPAYLRTLDDRNLSSGIAEAIKVAICGEPRLFELLEDRVREVMIKRDPEVLCEVVCRAASRKIELLAPDPLEVDLRRVLNLGHSFAHPLETELEYLGLLHGEAVGFGLAVSTAVARARGALRSHDAERIFRLLHRYGLPPTLPAARVQAAGDHVEAIRLVRANRLNFVLPTSVSTTEIVPELEAGEIARALDSIAAHPVIGGCITEDETIWNRFSGSISEGPSSSDALLTPAVGSGGAGG